MSINATDGLIKDFVKTMILGKETVTDMSETIDAFKSTQGKMVDTQKSQSTDEHSDHLSKTQWELNVEHEREAAPQADTQKTPPD